DARQHRPRRGSLLRRAATQNAIIRASWGVRASYARLAFQHQASIAQGYFNLGGCILQVSEFAPGDPEHQWVDLVDAQRVAGEAIGGESAASQAENPDAAGMPFQRLHTAADAALPAEVGDGQAPVLFAQHLLAVVDGAVNQPTRCIVVDPRIAIVEHAQLAVEVASYHSVSV